jgi:hypothetical protein
MPLTEIVEGNGVAFPESGITITPVLKNSLAEEIGAAKARTSATQRQA